MELDTVAKQYCEYICMNVDEKLRSGNRLAEAARILLSMTKTKLDNRSAIQREYLMTKIAEDLLKQTERMAYSKEYDCSPLIKEYTYLAFDLFYDYCEHKPDRLLLPFLGPVIYWESYNENKDYLNQLKELYTQSLALEQKYIEILKQKIT